MKKVHIIPHSHWDREWYMPYEQHHMLLIELIDDLIELFEKDPEYKSFHLDGQTIVLDDYLQVRPEKEEVLRKLVADGKLKVGPFYILQDDFLTTSESNARNMLIGAIESTKWTDDYVKLGYFPDTFGNMGQTPQLMEQIGIETAAFGRGVKPTGFGNQVFENEQYSSNFSEMIWKGPDGTEILGILFANWYSNGKEIPIKPEIAKVFWDKKLADVEKYAATDQLLMLNGSDHEPVQKNLSEAIRIANELYPEYEFVHSDFNTYVAEVKKDLKEISELNTIHGEITSQETEGWSTLANTASSRIYLKQENTIVSKLLEEKAEPLAVMAQNAGRSYPSDQLNYAWKLLMQNHPHDSICGCSVDEVHDEMMTRFHKVKEIGKYVSKESAKYLARAIDTVKMGEDSESIPFLIFNTSSSPKSGLAEVELVYDRELFDQKRESAPNVYKSMVNKKVPNFTVFDEFGKQLPIHEISTRVAFDFDLPKDGFRQSFFNRLVKFTIQVNGMKGYSFRTLKLLLASNKSKPAASESLVKGRNIETKKLLIDIQDNGSLNVINKETGERFKNLLLFEDMGDVGNEYVFRSPENDQTLSTETLLADVKILEDNGEYTKISIVHNLPIPKSMNDQLLIEQQSHVDYRERTAKRSAEMAILTLETVMIVEQDSNTITFTTKFDNQMKDHRLQVIFPTGKNVPVHYADSIFEVVERQNVVSSVWKNPENPQHTHAFVNVHDESGGLTVANIGLNEYEVTKNGEKIKLTLLRAVGEMGDWGYFPTEGSQCLGENEVAFAVTFHSPSGFYSSLHKAFELQVPFTVQETDYHTGNLSTDESFFDLKNGALKITALKRSQNKCENVLRFYNLDSKTQAYEVPNDVRVRKSNLLEEDLGDIEETKLKGYGIQTLLFKEVE